MAFLWINNIINRDLFQQKDLLPASNAYGAPYAKNAHFRHGGFARFLLVGKHPKPFESQVPCELRTLWALILSGIRFHFTVILL